MSTSSTPAVGIDLGTTFSVIAHLDQNGRPWTIPNAEGDLITPSVVFFDGDDVVVGKEAVKAGAFAPDEVAAFAKRDMGAASFHKPIRGESIPPEVIQSFVLEKLRRDASLKLGPFRKAVVSVPAFFNEPRRKATHDAGALAGLEVIDIINEPTAAAIAFGVQQGFLNSRGESGGREQVLVFDLGGGTFDVTLMDIEGSEYTTIATAGDVQLGGIDWDRRIVDFVAEEFARKHRGVDPRQNASSMARLMREAEDAKRSLSTRDVVALTIEHAGDALRLPLSRERFERLSADLVDRTRFTTVQLLEEAGRSWDDVTRLILVGGSSRMPMIQQMLERTTGKSVDRSLPADEAIAHGAAVYAGLILSRSSGGPKPSFRIQNVNSHDLSILAIEKSTGRPRRCVMIPRNTPLPFTKSACFRTQRENQSTVVVNVIEGGDQSGNDSTPIGKCIVRGLPAKLAPGTPVDVTFQYGHDGRLTVKASLPSIGQEAVLEIERPAGMSAERLEAWYGRLGGSETSGSQK